MREQITKWSIKAKIGAAGLKAYEVAEYMHLTESAFSKRLRVASPEHLAEIDAAVDALIQKKAS